MKKFDEYLVRFEKTAAKLLLIVMIVMVFSSGVARFLKNSMNWAVDFSSFLFAWACFFAMDIAWRENKMMSVDLFVKRLPAKVQRVIRIVMLLIILAFCVYMIIWGAQLTWTQRFRKFQGMPNFSYAWVTMAVPVGAALLARSTVQKIIKEFSNKVVKEAK
ncbi:C4-dicarboxylate ABC transporter [Pseudothermotoga hypogea DSM 11164 = NBRC 106472]|uniref:C4-dicarboxylate ABC transporter n=1 Tax=Pseudothermotoga hypogea DSM 11164 = NBRC 106472 TaxID=1123384 RepID=A0A0X1KSP1_9THEM|nr:TRAP transporter small permease [Pseudothermotoga hypogea]AJC74340.1 C4-dicarboxylate ABC transporter [Pseudothermotoga hypogea DSM 11164 = NBRC 106472]